MNLEATNLGALSTRVVPEPIELFTLDLSYLSLSTQCPNSTPWLTRGESSLLPS